jgi:hypothetical protein
LEDVCSETRVSLSFMAASFMEFHGSFMGWVFVGFFNFVKFDDKSDAFSRKPSRSPPCDKKSCAGLVLVGPGRRGLRLGRVSSHWSKPKTLQLGLSP